MQKHLPQAMPTYSMPQYGNPMAQQYPVDYQSHFIPPEGAQNAQSHSLPQNQVPQHVDPNVQAQYYAPPPSGHSQHQYATPQHQTNIQPPQQFQPQQVWSNSTIK